jgi:hypothetical protein
MHFAEHLVKVLDLGFMSVTAYIEEARAIKNEIEVAMIKSSHNLGQDPVQQLASLPFDYRDFGDVLQLLRKLEGKHWRCADAVRGVRMHTVREMSEINCKSEKLRTQAEEKVINQLDGTRCSRCARDVAYASREQNRPHFHAFLKSLLDENEVFDEISQQSLGQELQEMILHALGSELFTDFGRVKSVAIFSTRIQAAKILVQLVPEKWFGNPDNYSTWRTGVLGYANAKDCLTERMRGSEDAGKRLPNAFDKLRKGNPAWYLGALGFCNADAPLFVHNCRCMLHAVLDILASCTERSGYRQETMDAKKYLWDLQMNVASVTLDLRPFVELIVDRLQVENDATYYQQTWSSSLSAVELAAETSGFLAVFYDVVSCVWNQKSSVISSQPHLMETKVLIEGSLMRGAMRVWWRCWRGSGSGSDTLKIIMDAAKKLGHDVPFANLDPELVEKITVNAKPPPEFLQCRTYSSTQAFFDSCQPGQSNVPLQDFLRLASLHIHRSILPSAWIPTEAEVIKSFRLVKAYFMSVFLRGVLPDSTPRKVKKWYGNDVVRNTITLLVCKDEDLNQKSTYFKNMPAKEKRHLDFVFGKFEATRVPSLLKDVVWHIHDDFLLPEERPTGLPQSSMSYLIQVVHKLCSLEREMAQAIMKVIKAHSGSKYFKAVYEGKGGVMRYCRVENEGTGSGVVGAAGSGDAEGLGGS